MKNLFKTKYFSFFPSLFLLALTLLGVGWIQLRENSAYAYDYEELPFCENRDGETVAANEDCEGSDYIYTDYCYAKLYCPMFAYNDYGGGAPAEYTALCNYIFYKLGRENIGNKNSCDNAAVLFNPDGANSLPDDWAAKEEQEEEIIVGGYCDFAPNQPRVAECEVFDGSLESAEAQRECYADYYCTPGDEECKYVFFVCGRAQEDSCCELAKEGFAKGLEARISPYDAEWGLEDGFIVPEDSDPGGDGWLADLRSWGDKMTAPEPPVFEGNLSGIIDKVLGYLFPIAGIIALIFIIMGGYMWIVSAGDPNKVKQAQGTLTWAVVGLIIVMVIFGIIRILLNFLS